MCELRVFHIYQKIPKGPEMGLFYNTKITNIVRQHHVKLLQTIGLRPLYMKHLPWSFSHKKYERPLLCHLPLLLDIMSKWKCSMRNMDLCMTKWFLCPIFCLYVHEYVFLCSKNLDGTLTLRRSLYRSGKSSIVLAEISSLSFFIPSSSKHFMVSFTTGL